MADSWVLLGVEGPPRRIEDVVPTGLAGLGFTGGTGLEVTVHPAPRGLWAQLELSRTQAHALATRAAVQLGRPVRLITAHQADPARFELELTDDRVAPDGKRSPTFGSEARALVELHESDWSSVCDGKPRLLLSSVLEALLDTLELTDATPERHAFAPPPSLGTPKLDALATRIRCALQATVTRIEGRPAVRLKTLDGGTDLDVLTEETLAILKQALPDLG